MPPITLAFHLDAPTAAGDTFELPLKGSRESVHLSKTPVLTLAEVEKAAPVPDSDGKPTVLLFLKKKGVEKLSAATASAKGKRLGIVVDGQLILAPVIMDKMIHDKMFLGAADDAEVLAKRINEGVQHQ